MGDDIFLHQILEILFRRRRLFVGAFSIVFVALTIVMVLNRDQVQSVATIEIGRFNDAKGPTPVIEPLALKELVTASLFDKVSANDPALSEHLRGQISLHPAEKGAYFTVRAVASDDAKAYQRVLLDQIMISLRALEEPKQTLLRNKIAALQQATEAYAVQISAAVVEKERLQHEHSVLMLDYVKAQKESATGGEDRQARNLRLQSMYTLLQSLQQQYLSVIPDQLSKYNKENLDVKNQLDAARIELVQQLPSRISYGPAPTKVRKLRLSAIAVIASLASVVTALALVMAAEYWAVNRSKILGQ